MAHSFDERHCSILSWLLWKTMSSVSDFFMFSDDSFVSNHICILSNTLYSCGNSFLLELSFRLTLREHNAPLTDTKFVPLKPVGLVRWSDYGVDKTANRRMVWLIWLISVKIEECHLRYAILPSKLNMYICETASKIETWWSVNVHQGGNVRGWQNTYQRCKSVLHHSLQFSRILAPSWFVLTLWMRTSNVS